MPESSAKAHDPSPAADSAPQYSSGAVARDLCAGVFLQAKNDKVSVGPRVTQNGGPNRCLTRSTTSEELKIPRVPTPPSIVTNAQRASESAKMESEMEEFLKLEYEKCLDLIRYYDERHVSLVKFTTGASSSIVSLIFGFYALGGDVHAYFWEFSAVLTGVTGTGLLAIFAAMLQNRLYFVFPARQVNAIRRTMLARIKGQFNDNHMYVSTEVRAFKWLSLHTFMNLLVVMQVSVFGAFSWYCATVNPTNPNGSIARAMWIAGTLTVVLMVASAFYLQIQGARASDHAVHSVKEKTQ